MEDYRQALKSIVLAEITRYKKETGMSLPSWRDRLDSYVDMPDHFVTFSTIPKLGVNPINAYGTPTGIYAYPLSSKIESHVTFAKDRPYAIVFKPKQGTNILKVESYSYAQLQADIEKLLSMHGSVWESDNVDGVIKRARNAVFPRARNLDADPVLAAKLLWQITKNLASDLNFAKNEKATDVGTDFSQLRLRVEATTPNEWARVFLSLGYQGVVDTGHQIIHQNEPSQAVFFSSNAVEAVDMVQKPTDEYQSAQPDDIMQIKRAVAAGKSLSGIPIKEQLAHLNLSGKHVDGLTVPSPIGTGGSGGSLYMCSFAGSLLTNWKLLVNRHSNLLFASATIRDMQLGKADKFSYVTIAESSFQKSKITNLSANLAMFDSCNFKGATIKDSKFYTCSFISSEEFDGVTFDNVTFISSKVGTSLNKSKVLNTTFDACRLEYLLWSDNEFRNTTFDTCTIQGKVNFKVAKDVTFDKCVFTDVKFNVTDPASTVNFEDCVFHRVTMSQKTFDLLLATNPQLQAHVNAGYIKLV